MRAISLSGPYLSTEKFFTIKSYKIFHDTGLKEVKYLGLFILIVLLKHFWKHACLKTILHDC